MQGEVGVGRQPLGGGLLSSSTTARTGGTIGDALRGHAGIVTRVLVGTYALQGGGEARGGAQRALVGRAGAGAGRPVASSARPGSGVPEAVRGDDAVGCRGRD